MVGGVVIWGCMAKLFGHRSNKQIARPNPGGLLGDFQLAWSIIETVERSKFIAEQTESDTLHKLASFNQTNGIYVTPADIAVNHHDQLTHASLDAHIQKVQSNQIEQYGHQQLQDLQMAVDHTYLRQKIRVRVVDKQHHPIHSCRQDKTDGQYYYADNRSRSVAGKIKLINLVDNYLIIQPSLGRRLTNKTIEYYLVEVINPLTNRPVIQLNYA